MKNREKITTKWKKLKEIFWKSNKADKLKKDPMNNVGKLIKRAYLIKKN